MRFEHFFILITVIFTHTLQEMKLDALCKPELPQLAQLLHLLASDAQAANFVEHYWRDFPSICSPYLESVYSYSRSMIMKLILFLFLRSARCT